MPFLYQSADKFILVDPDQRAESHRREVTVGHSKTFRRLKRTVERALDAGGSAPALIAELLEEDDHGLLPWCFGEIGRTVEPFSDLRLQQPDTWMACEAAFR